MALSLFKIFDKETSPKQNTRRPRMHHNARTIVLLLFAVVLGVALYPLYTLFYVTTNDAQVDGHILPINSRINGTVKWVNPDVENTHRVKAGEVLALLDANDYAPTVEQLQGEVAAQQAQLNSAQLDYAMTKPTAQSHLQAAHAAVAEAQADLASNSAEIQSREAHLAETRATFQHLEEDRRRYQSLVGTHEISNSEYGQRATAAKTANEQVAQAIAQLKTAQAQHQALENRLEQRRAELEAANIVPETIGAAEAHVKQMDGNLKKSAAQLQEAQLNLSYTTIVAPADGVIGQRQLEVGQRVQTGQLLLTVVPLNDLWITADFKETQLRKMHVGQPVNIKLDSYEGKINGHIESIGGATGARYSLIPPENATGNYVKVVQRIPVRIRIDSPMDPRHPLLPGMSAEVAVRLD
jgi:membrane fusion protein (multidrug efflux system)